MCREVHVERIVAADQSCFALLRHSGSSHPTWLPRHFVLGMPGGSTNEEDADQRLSSAAGRMHLQRSRRTDPSPSQDEPRGLIPYRRGPPAPGETSAQPSVKTGIRFLRRGTKAIGLHRATNSHARLARRDPHPRWLDLAVPGGRRGGRWRRPHDTVPSRSHGWGPHRARTSASSAGSTTAPHPSPLTSASDDAVGRRPLPAITAAAHSSLRRR